MSLEILGISPIGNPKSGNLDPTYIIDGKRLGQGLKGYESVLLKLRGLPLGSKVRLRRDVGLSPASGAEEGSGKFTGDLRVGAHPFSEPAEAFTRLRRIASERQLQLEFIPRLDTGDDTPTGLLHRILRLSRAKQYDELRQCLYPLSPGKFDLRDVMLDYIRKQDSEHTGDFSYSDEALQIACDQCLDTFSPGLNKSWKEQLMGGSLEDPRLRQLAERHPNRFSYLEHGRLSILVVRVDDEYKLVFWEGLNSLREQGKSKR